jgi:ankyrin repeat protein
LRGHAGLTALLLDHGADARLTDDAGNSTLHFAARSGSAAVIDALLEHGADARVVNAIGMSPGADARRRGYSTVAQRLRPQDVEPSERTSAAARDEHPVAYGVAAPAEPGPRVQVPGPRVQ